MDYLVPAREMEFEDRVLNSRFITRIGLVRSREAADHFLQAAQEKYPDATHHVPVYLIGHGSSVLAHASDDGEPAGTAGKPALAVLRGSGLGDTALVITRYFGGTKLGTGGLVRAYGDAARRAVREVPKARQIHVDLYKTEVKYPLYEQAVQLIRDHGGSVQSQNFKADVTLQFLLPQKARTDFNREFSALTRGRAELLTEETGRTALLPIHPKKQRRSDD